MIVSRRATLLAALALALGPVRVQAQGTGAIMDAPSAAGLPRAGGLLIDVRTRASSARPACPRPPCASPSRTTSATSAASFAQEVLKAAGDDPGRPIALIDADGRRANYAARLLAAQGFTQAFAVAKGCSGAISDRGGWRGGCRWRPVRECWSLEGKVEGPKQVEDGRLKASV